MAETGIKELLEAGVHFGHQTRRWDPAMRRYIHGERDGIHIIDLLQTEQLLERAREFTSELAGRGGKILFVGTKKQSRDAIEEWAEKCGMPYVSRRWLGGLLTNFQTINKRIKRLHELQALSKEGQLELLPTKERMAREAELRKLEFNLGGVRDMQRPPDAIVIIDMNTEEIAVNEAARLGIPIVGLVDTNCDPRPVSYVIPGNDDAIRSCELIVRTLGESILTSATAFKKAEEARRKREEEERARREEEARKKREEEEARKAAEEAAKAEAAKAKAEAEAAAGKGAAGAPAAPARQSGGGKRTAPAAAGSAAAETKAAPKAKPAPAKEAKSPAKEAKPAAAAKAPEAKPAKPEGSEEATKPKAEVKPDAGEAPKAAGEEPKAEGTKQEQPEQPNQPDGEATSEPAADQAAAGAASAEGEPEK